jgi:hypothetical protein
MRWRGAHLYCDIIPVASGSAERVTNADDAAAAFDVAVGTGFSDWPVAQAQCDE